MILNKTRPQISILFGHYSEDKERDRIALECIKRVSDLYLDNSNIEIIVTCNGHYPESLDMYCDAYKERDVDILPGRTINEGVALARGDIFFIMSNDILIEPGAVEQCAELVTKYPMYMATPIYPKQRQFHERPSVDGYNVNLRLGSNCMCMTRKQFEDIGPFDEVLINFDMINYINRWIRKGYAVMMTKEILATDISNSKHSYTKLQEQTGFKKYVSRKAIYDKQTLDRIRSERGI